MDLGIADDHDVAVVLEAPPAPSGRDRSVELDRHVVVRQQTLDLMRGTQIVIARIPVVPAGPELDTHAFGDERS